MAEKPEGSESQNPKPFRLKTGKRPQPVKHYSPGDVLFTEGEAGRELFYIEEGEVIISVGEKEDRVELARIGAGNYIGEMALLDNLPRSATVTTTAKTKAVITTESAFEELFNHLPLWLSSVVKILIARLRETNRKVGLSPLTYPALGVANFLKLLIDEQISSGPTGQKCALDYFDTISELQLATRLTKPTIESILEFFKNLEILNIIPTEGSKHIQFPTLQPLLLFIEYYRLARSGTIHSLPQLQSFIRIIDKLKNECNNEILPDSIKRTGKTFTVPPARLAKLLAHLLPQFQMRDFTALSKTDVFSIEENRGLSFSMETLDKGMYKYRLFQKLAENPKNIEPVDDEVYARIEKRKGTRTTTKPGIVPKTPYEKNFEKGGILFKEGEPGNEMFIIRKGRISIQKKTGGHDSEVSRLGPGTILGEMSLLDGAPRSATAKALEDVSVTYINKELFNKTMAAIPCWTAGLVKTIVARLREVTVRRYRELLSSGLLAMCRILLSRAANQEAASIQMLQNQLLEKVHNIFGLSFPDIRKLVEYLIQIKLAERQVTQTGATLICPKAELIELLYDYHRIHRIGQKTLAEMASAPAKEAGKILYSAGQTRGSQKDGECRLDFQQLELHLEANEIDEEVLSDEAIRELTQLGLLRSEEKNIQSSQGQSARRSYVYGPQGLPRLIKQLEWQKAFATPLI